MKKYFLINAINPSVPNAQPDVYVTETCDDVSVYVANHPELIINVKTVDTLPL